MLNNCHEIIGSVTRTEHITIDFNDMVDLLSSAIPAIGYWGIVDYSEEGYLKARESLHSHPKFKNAGVICFEEVLTEGLRKGFLTLDIWDREEDANYQLSLGAILNGIDIYFNMELGVEFEDMDGAMADCIIQCACFGEVIYG